MTPEMHKDFVDDSVSAAMHMLDEGESQHRILTFLVEAAQEAARNETVSSILLLDDNGLLRNAASPNLPYEYLTAIDGLKPNPKVGTCAAAAATGNMVITLDFTADDKWEELRHLPMALGFLGAWSMPIKSEAGKVLGHLWHLLQRVPPTFPNGDTNDKRIRAYSSQSTDLRLGRSNILVQQMAIIPTFYPNSRSKNPQFWSHEEEQNHLPLACIHSCYSILRKR